LVKNYSKWFSFSFVALGLVAPADRSVAASEELKPIVITIQDHRFTPAEIHIPAGKRCVFIVRNLDSSAEEIESAALKIEKLVGAKSEAKIVLSPAAHGHYTFLGEYHEKSARGVIIVD
jgi:plastocyanin